MSPRSEGKDELYTAARRFVDDCLTKNGSLFSPDEEIWTLPILDDLHARFVDHPDTSGDPFNVKFARQLDEAPDQTVQLAAEVLFIHFLPASNVGGPRKRELVNQVLSWMKQPMELPPELDAVLDVGLMHMGVAFNTGRNHGVAFLIDFARSWKQLPPNDQVAFLADPWGFKDFLFDLPIFGAHPQRQALLHLVHPETFEDIASGDHKREMAAAFHERASGASDDVDKQLAEIRASFEAGSERRISFYEPAIYEQWHQQGVREAVQGDTDGQDLPVVRRAWLIRGTTKSGESLVPRWLAEAFVSIGFQHAGQLLPGASRSEIREKISQARPDDSPGKTNVTAGMVDRFINEIAVNDLVITPQGKKVYVGVITSDQQWRPVVPGEQDQTARRREVEWTNAESPIARNELSEGLYSKLRTLLTLTDVTDYADEIASLAGIVEEVKVPSAAPAIATVPDATNDLEEATLLPRRWLQDVLDLMTRKRQVVFYGPPGTGKTFVAQAIGDHVVGAGGNYRLVQFHPSYTYEDFFEGFRPRVSGTDVGVGFELVPGPLREMAEAALDDPGHPYLLIIDEINRANIAKVFGELYFLLEYRDAAVSLLYSPDREFQLPKNLYVIGTMNTADRSIALVDAAMRRRFYFFRFSPESEPIASVLDRWLSGHGLNDEPARLLEELNREIDDPDFAIGPSYLMDVRITEDGELGRVWTHAILPLLEEHFFGTETDVQTRFDLPSIRARLQAESPQNLAPQSPDDAQ